MQNNELKEQRLKTFLKNQIRGRLLEIGRKLVMEKGADYLTARKLSEASNVSVGTIYNQFATMDNFIIAENMQTLDELHALLKIIIPTANPYITLNRYADVFSDFVFNNLHLWQLLFREHLNNRSGRYPAAYIRRVKRIERLANREIEKLNGCLSREESRLAAQVLETALFALSGFIASPVMGRLGKVPKNNIGKLLLNTYLAGLTALKKVK